MYKFWIQVLMAAFLVSAARGQTWNHLWVVKEPDEIVRYDLPSFEAGRSIKVPHRLVQHPEYLAVNSKGQLLFHPPQDVEWGGGEMAAAGRRVWFWDGRQAREWIPEGTRKIDRRGGKTLLTEAKPQCFLSADGEHLFWFENRFEKVTDDLGVELSVRTSSRVWRTDLSGRSPEMIANLSSPGKCDCQTGACSESCPEWCFWAPGGVVGDFFFITRFTPGQIGSTYHESHVYQRSGQNWLAKKLARPIERPLDASDRGEIMIAAVPDGGCCGWENDGNDQLLFLRKAEVFVLYDEFNRYRNSDYDVSFYPRKARLGPGNRAVAYTVASTALAGGEIRLSSGGKENPEALARVRKGIGETPAVEIVLLGSKPQLMTRIARASFVGWLGGDEILVTKDRQLVIYDKHGKMVKQTDIRVRGAADAFLP